MSTARLYVNVDEGLKRNTQRIFNEMGMDMTTAINLFLKTVEREERFPLDIRTKQAYLEHEAAHREYIRTELEKAKISAADPNTKWVSQEEMVALLKKQGEELNGV